MKLHILTLHWNAVDKIKKLHQTLIPCLEGLNYNWLIKDNGSIDNSIEFLKSIESDSINLYLRGHNRDSFSEGMNILFEKANPKDDDYIMLLNNDLWFGNDNVIKTMINQFKDGVGVVGARIFYPNGDLLQHAGVYFSQKYNYIPYHYRHGEKDDVESRKTREFEAVTGALLLTKAKYYKQICMSNKSGRVGLAEDLFWCFDDIDACLSIKYNMGKKIIYCGKTVVYHEESSSLKKNPVNKMMWGHNLKTFKSRWDGKFKKFD
jgi:GT2 family glycosyltransferase